MIYTVTLNPAVDKTVVINDFKVDSVNRVSSLRTDAGGKGINVSKVIKSLGGRSKAMGILGGSAGRYVKKYLDDMGIDNDFVFISGETRTNLKVIDGKNGTNTDINEPGPNVSECELELLKDKLLDQVANGSIVVFSGSVPENVDKDIYFRWIDAVKQKGAAAILDADGELLKKGIEAGPYLVKPNIYELGRLFGTDIKDIGKAVKYAETLIRDFAVGMVAVSMGKDGALFVDKSRVALVHALKVNVQSTVGAGDSMVAALAYSIGKGMDYESMVRLAAASASANVMTSGSQPADISVIRELEGRVTFEYLRS
ncbi:MAG TPA: 1-phosphofructokinase [Clostridiales bacterium]|nr:1-phosphofructokinase [Clostridiales bacterium]HOL92352.1 1-phosphofructokinase [Clostridiales bacterium]HPP36435.1 1-phosphofructokinase [Clostridiales bacterium]